MEYTTFIVTNAGRAFMANLMQNGGEAEFSTIKLSSRAYTDQELVELTALDQVEQSAPITRKTLVDATTIQIEGAVDNRTLSAGYFIQTIGLFVQDAVLGEILYAGARAVAPEFMPPFDNGIVSGGYFKITVGVGTADQVNMTVDPAGYASIGDVQDLRTGLTSVAGGVQSLRTYAQIIHGKANANEGDIAQIKRVLNVTSNIEDMLPLNAGHIPVLGMEGKSVAQVLEEMTPVLLYNGNWSSDTITLTKTVRRFRFLVLVQENNAAIVHVNTSMNGFVKYPWSSGTDWNLVEQYYIINQTGSTGTKLNMAGTLKYVNGVYASAADPITKIYGLP